MPRHPRVTPGLGINPTPVRPSASPTDTFIPFTGNAASGPLRELASSLSRFGEQGRRFAAKQQKKQQEEQTEAGRTAFLKELEEQQDTAKALKALELRPQQSRFFRAAVQAAAGQVDALRARDFFYSSKADELEDAVTLEEFDALAGEALDEFRGDDAERTKAYENGFFPSYIAVMENARFEFARSIDGKLSEDRLRDYDISNLAMMDMYLRGDGSRAGLGAVLTDQLDAMQRDENPLLYPDLQKIIVKNLKAIAFAVNDITILEIAKDIKIGPSGPEGRRTSLWVRYRGGSDGLEKTGDKLIALETRDRTIQDARDQQAEDIAFRGIEDQLVEALMGAGEGERTALVEDLIDQATEIGGFARGNELRNAMENTDRFADVTVGRVFDSVQRSIWEGRSSAAKIMNSRGGLSRAATASLLGQLRAYNATQKEGSSEHTLTNDPRVTGFKRRLRQRFAQAPGGILTADQGNRAGAAEIQFIKEIALNTEMLRALPEIEMLEWMQSHSNIAFDSFVGGFQLSLGQEGSLLETVAPPSDQAISSQEELETAFGFRSDLAVSDWGHSSNLTMDFGDFEPPGYVTFVQRWNAMRPDAPVGSGQAFIDAWAAYKLNRDGRTSE